uniref:Uncharacterized protein n=1 Tax=Arundo donax TaxID=35708 RepID=A0A0A9D4D4_ARUDO
MQHVADVPQPVVYAPAWRGQCCCRWPPGLQAASSDVCCCAAGRVRRQPMVVACWLASPPMFDSLLAVTEAPPIACR